MILIYALLLTIPVIGWVIFVALLLNWAPTVTKVCATCQKCANSWDPNNVRVALSAREIRIKNILLLCIIAATILISLALLILII